MKTNNNIFWVSYSDLMTSLFFVMMILFVLSIGYLNEKQEKLKKKYAENERIITENQRLIDTINKQKKRQQIEIEKLKKLLNIEKQFTPLEKDSSFIYLKDCKKYVIKDFLGVEIFAPMETYILPQYIDKTVEIGKKIESFLQQLYNDNPELNYLLVIEGNTANKPDDPWNKDERTAYKRSYERALAVYLLWRRNNIDFRKYNTEILIAGSGFNGLCRDNIERNNKRFSIQIIPKVESIKNEKK